MYEKLLSISEAARLLGVCVNTLRDWDIDGKFEAIRTAGGHRRYSLDQVREHLIANPPRAEGSDSVPFHVSPVDKVLERWRDDLTDVVGDTDRRALAILFENICLYYTNSPLVEDSPFSTSQAIWLIKNGWLRSKLRKAVSIQPMMGPTSLVYYLNEKCFHESEAIAAKTYGYQFTVYRDAEFNSIRDVYADVLAEEIDQHILSYLPAVNIEVLLDSVMKLSDNLSASYDYVAAPWSYIELLQGKAPGVDLIGISATTDRNSFMLRAAAGRYPVSNFHKPIFAPYILLNFSPTLLDSVKKVSLRAGWLKDN